MPLDYQQFEVWLFVEVLMTIAVVVVVTMFLVLRTFFAQKGEINVGAITCTFTEETDFLVAQGTTIGYLTSLGTPAIITLCLKMIVDSDRGTLDNITMNEVTNRVFHSFLPKLQWVSLYSGLHYIFFSLYKMEAWPEYVYVGPKIHFALFVVLDMIFIPGTTCSIVFGFNRLLKQSGFYSYFMLCAWL